MMLTGPLNVTFALWGYIGQKGRDRRRLVDSGTTVVGFSAFVTLAHGFLRIVL